MVWTQKLIGNCRFLILNGRLLKNLANRTSLQHRISPNQWHLNRPVNNRLNLIQSLKTRLILVNRTSLQILECCPRMHLLLHLFPERLQILHRLKDRMKLRKFLNLLILLILLCLLVVPLESRMPLTALPMNLKDTRECVCLVDP